MSRIRTVKPEFWQHPKVTSVSRDARLFFLGLLNEADDLGRTRFSPKRLAGVLFGEDDDVDADQILDWTDELEKARLVERYVVDDAQLLLVLGFTEHQSINRPSPSRLPGPPGSPESFVELSSVNAPGMLPAGKEQGTGKQKRSQPREDFVPTESHAQFCSEHGLALETERAHWLEWCEAHGKTFVSQNAGFATWLRQAVAFGRGGRPVATLDELAEPVAVRGPWVCPAGNPECVDGFMDIVGERYAEECECRMKTRSG